ncbi:MAG: cupin fold metalloprotein, WbuC family [Rhodocyclaceae bacterium]|nr:MAG: cupin fold metalloprotein, WbuC family [Rhodocyclaceae bacterium]
MIPLIDTRLLDEVSAEAKAAPRGRKNRNFHPANEFPAHRLLNAVQPGSYIAPHRHNDPNKDETMVVLRGALGLVEFDVAGNVLRCTALQAGGEVLGCDIPHGTFHTVLALAPDTVFLEAKAGPYAALADSEKATWAPQEGDAGAAAYLAALRARFD